MNPDKTISRTAVELGMNLSMVGYVKLKVCGFNARTKKPDLKYTEERATRAKRTV
jgi:hypothetical protein